MRHALPAAAALLALGSAAGAQAPAPPGPAAQPALSEFVGTYAGDPGESAVEVIVGGGLFAVIDEAKYRLKREGDDGFRALSGDPVSFRRDPSGRIVGYQGRNGFHARLSAQVTPASLALARPVPPDAPAYRYRVPADRHDGLPVGDIAATPLGRAAAEAIVAGVRDGTWKDVQGVLLFQGGRLVMEEYFYGYGPDRPHQLRSATKSVVSAVVGAAVDRGALAVDAPVLPRLPYAAYAAPDPRKAKITLRHLLTMSPGLACDDHDGASPGRETVIDEAPDWVKATLDLPMTDDPGTVAHYCSGAVSVAGRTVERATGESLPNYAAAHLFGPLGIKRSDWRWNYTLTNANREYSQIHLRPRDMLKLGLLYAQGGVWRGKPVLSKAWVDASLAAQSTLENTRYGYFWWGPWLTVATPGGDVRVDLHAAQGNGGQKIYVVLQYDLVAVFTGGDYNSGGSPPNKIMAKVVLPPLLAASAKR